MWTRRELKDKAKGALRMNYWKTVLVALLVMAIAASIGSSAGAGGVSSQIYRADPDSQYTETYVITDDMTPEEIADMLEQIESGDVSVVYDLDDLDGVSLSDPDISAEELVDGVGIEVNHHSSSVNGPEIAIIGFVAGLVALAILAIAVAFDAFVINPLNVGFSRFFTRNLNQPAEVREVAYGYDNNYREIVKTMFLRELFTLLWSLLLIIPGIVKAYEYRMIPYLLADDPTMTSDRAFAESRRMMDGNKWRAFVLDLSFIGWGLLSVITLGLVGIFYAGPYQLMTNAALYEELRYGSPELGDGSRGDGSRGDGYVAPGEVPVPPFAAIGAEGLASGSVAEEAAEE